MNIYFQIWYLQTSQKNKQNSLFYKLLSLTNAVHLKIVYNNENLLPTLRLFAFVLYFSFNKLTSALINYFSL